MTLEELARAIADAGEDAEALRAVVRRCGKSMAEAGVDGIALADALLGLMGHADSRVRQEVAASSDLFPEPFFGLAYAALSKDTNHFVCAAAERASERKAVQKKAHAKTQAKGRELAETIAELGKQFGPAARKLGARAATLGALDQSGRAGHEVRRAMEALGNALGEMERELERPAPGPGTLREQMKVASERFEYLLSVTNRSSAAPGQTKPPRGAFVRQSLRELVEKARDHVRAVARANVEIVLEVDRALVLDADGPSLRQAIENVLKNAVEAQSGRAGVVRVCARSLRKGAVIELEVEDAGVGMGEEEIARLFVPFESRKLGGTGVGMVTVRKIVEEIHRGELEVSSREGEGTRVLLRLPGKQVGA